MKCKNRFCVIFISSFIVLGLLLSSVAFGGEDQAVLVLQKSGTKVTLLDTFFLDTKNGWAVGAGGTMPVSYTHLTLPTNREV